MALIKIPIQNSDIANNRGISLISETARSSYSLGKELALDQGCNLSNNELKNKFEDNATFSTNTITTGGNIAATTGLRE